MPMLYIQCESDMDRPAIFFLEFRDRGGGAENHLRSARRCAERRGKNGQKNPRGRPDAELRGSAMRFPRVRLLCNNANSA